LLKASLLLLSAAALIFADTSASAAATSQNARRTPLRVVPVITMPLLQKQALMHTHKAQSEAETRIAGPRARRALVHAQAVAGTKPIVLGVRPGGTTLFRGSAVPTVVVSVLAYGLYETDPAPATRQIDYTYNTQNGALVAERARIADAATALRYGLPALHKGAQKK
jgi:hypothetical protein